MYVTY